MSNEFAWWDGRNFDDYVYHEDNSVWLECGGLKFRCVVAWWNLWCESWRKLGSRRLISFSFFTKRSLLTEVLKTPCLRSIRIVQWREVQSAMGKLGCNQISYPDSRKLTIQPKHLSKGRSDREGFVFLEDIWRLLILHRPWTRWSWRWMMQNRRERWDWGIGGAFGAYKSTI